MGIGAPAGGHSRAPAPSPCCYGVHCRRTDSLSTQRLRELLRIGLPLTASTLVQATAATACSALLIGGTAGAAALGQAYMAFRLVDAVRELAFTAQWRLMLPVLSQHQNALSALRASMIAASPGPASWRSRYAPGWPSRCSHWWPRCLDRPGLLAVKLPCH